MEISSLHAGRVFALEYYPSLLGLVAGVVLGGDRRNLHLHQHSRLRRDNPTSRMVCMASQPQKTCELGFPERSVELLYASSGDPVFMVPKAAAKTLRYV